MAICYEFIPRVVCAAIRNGDGLIICGPRHFDMIMQAQMDVRPELWEGYPDQGFIDQRGNWLTREEAHAIAAKQGQIIRRCGGDKFELFSENLY